MRLRSPVKGPPVICMRELYLNPQAQGSVSRGFSRFAFMKAKIAKGKTIVEHKMIAISGVETILPKFEVKFIPWLAT